MAWDTMVAEAAQQQLQHVANTSEMVIGELTAEMERLVLMSAEEQATWQLVTEECQARADLQQECDVSLDSLMPRSLL